MLKLQNNVETVDIDILGGIGESWFDDETSMQSIKTVLNDAKGKVVNINISSLGGDVDHAITIYDMLKMHDAPVNVRVIGATASSGTIIAMSGRNVEMSENALFLVHNVWTMAVGNAEEMRKTAEDLDKFDARLVDIYQKQINKNKKNKKKSEILALMEDEKWIDATEALAWGFVDSIIKDGRVINNDIRKQINKTEYLPNLEIMENKLLTGIKALFGINEDTQDEQILAKVSDLKAELEQKQSEIEAKEAEIETLKEEVQTIAEKVANIEAIEANHTSAIQAKVTEISDLQAKYDALEVEANKLKAEKSGAKAEGDPDVNAGTKQESELQKTIKKVQASVQPKAKYYKS